MKGRLLMQSRRHGKDDRMISPQIILNHPVDFITKDDLPGNEANPHQMEDNKAPPSAAPQGGGASRRPLGFLFFSVFPMIFGGFPMRFSIFSNFLAMVTFLIARFHLKT